MKNATELNMLGSMTEKQIQDQIRNAADFIPGVQLFRANVGGGWQGRYFKKFNGIFLPEPHWFTTGLPKGFPDLFGYRLRVISPDMLNKIFAEFFWIEVKTPSGRVSNEQLDLHRVFRSDGVPGDICRSLEEALILLKGGV